MSFSAIVLSLTLFLFDVPSPLSLNVNNTDQEDSIVCKAKGSARAPAFSMEGDYIIGGVFSIHYSMHTVIPNYTNQPEPLRCTGSVDSRELRFAQAMIFAIEEINNSSTLLPGVTLGYQIHDSCASVPVAVQAAFHLVSGHVPEYHPHQRCSQSGMVMGIVGESGSTPSISISRVTRLFNIPQVSHYATCACLSDKLQYPSFFRTIPSDKFQADALVRLVKRFGWTWIGAVYSDSDYGINGMATFLSAARKIGICVEYSEAFYRTNSLSRIQRVAQIIRRSTATVVVAFAASGDIRILLEELCQEPVPYRQWVGSEAWVTDPDLFRFSSCVGAVGLGIQQSVIPGLKKFLSDLTFSTASASPLLSQFWEESFQCKMPTNASPDDAACDGSEDMLNLQNPYTDTSQLRITNMVYKAVYAIAHAIHNAVCLQNTTCQFNSFVPLQFTQVSHIQTYCLYEKLESLLFSFISLFSNSFQVLAQIKKVNFSQNGYSVSFDANGDPVATYELVNWQTTEQGTFQLETVGHFDASQPNGQEFKIQKVLQWIKGTTQVPKSVCSQSCAPGTRKVLQKGKPICCYDCIACAEGEISNITEPGNHPGCVLSGRGCLAILTAAVFLKHRNTPIVKANNSELSFWLLLSLTLCFLCSLTFIGAPSEWSCMLRHTAFGITFVLCISCVLGKTIVVLMAFRATLPGSNVMKWFGPPQQRMTVVSFTLIQVLICIIWLVVNPPFPIKNLTTYKDKIILQCALGSPIGFWAVLGYIGLLALLCFVLAFLARKLPDNFNEAKFITFSMLISVQCGSLLSQLMSALQENSLSPWRYLLFWPQVMDCFFVFFCQHVILYSLSQRRTQKVFDDFDFRAFRWMMTMVFAVEEINRDLSLLPGVKLGYRIMDSCDQVHNSLQAVLSLLSQTNKHTTENEKLNHSVYSGSAGAESCLASSPVSAVIGLASSTPTRAVAHTLGPFNIPLVSYFATCTCLTNKKMYPSFLRTVPSDLFQVGGLVQLVTFLGWNWVGTIGTTDDYSQYGIQAFTHEFSKHGGCVAFHITIPKSPSVAQVQNMAARLQSTTAQVVVVFATEGQLIELFSELSQRNVTGIQWVASEAWVTASLLTSEKFHDLLEGTVGFSFSGVYIPGLKEFLLSVRPSSHAGMELVNMFWEELFDCKLLSFSSNEESVGAVRKKCSGLESLGDTDSSYTDVAEVRISYNVYKATYALGHAVHQMLNCDAAKKLLLHHLKHVNFTDQFGEKVYFDSSGEPVPLYDIINWQKDSEEKIRLIKVGSYDGSAPLGQQLRMEKSNITWTTGLRQVPLSQCSIPCPPGTRKATRLGQPPCCFDCLPCGDGEISNQSGSTECTKCPRYYWSDKDKIKCVAGVEEFLSYSDTMGIILVFLTVLGVSLTVVITTVFHCFRSTPIVKANNSEISFLLLVSLKLCFLCSLVFIGQPSVWTCRLRQAAFGISFVLCLSCLLTVQAHPPENSHTVHHCSTDLSVRWLAPSSTSFSIQKS
ncbi:hypothetical protein WMY93_017813 [Mugilogobius chulae]|uniref:G-protein coupled receptors family 3 profile domain-containing protein n=1 Tax=Mugilogobius chulae TaxID=88201 RepID=A0AAW0NPT1_9GOBI